MGKLALTTTATVAIKVAPKVTQMLVARGEEHTRLQAQKKEIEDRLERLKGEIDQLFKKEKQTDALCDGTKVGGYGFKLVCGTGTRINIAKLIELGCDPEWIEEATETFDKKPYIKITAPKKKGEDSEEE